MTKRKDERRELLKEDEFLSILERAARHIRENRTQAILIGAGAIVVLAAIFGAIAWQRSQSHQAAGTLYQAERILGADLESEDDEFDFPNEKARYEAALAELDQVIAKTSGAAKHQALSYKATCLINLGRHDELESVYRELADAPGFRVFGLMGMGDYYYARDRYEEALAQFRKLAETDAGDAAHYKLAMTYKALSQNEEARAELDKILNKPEGAAASPYQAKAQELLDAMEQPASEAGNS